MQNIYSVKFGSSLWWQNNGEFINECKVNKVNAHF